MSNVVEKIREEYDSYSPAVRWVILIAVMLGTLMEVVDSSIVNVAVPSMMGNLGATLEQIGWVSTGYIIANVIVLPLTGWLSSRFGRRRYLASSMAIFTIASLFCGVAHSLNMLVLFRIVQGAGGAALLSTAQATMMEIFPRKQLGMVQAIYGIGVMVGPTLGPTMGGWIVDHFSWPWIFFINLPIGILAITMTLLYMHDSRYTHSSAKSVDVTGIGFLAVGLGCLQMLLEKGNAEGWFSSSYICWLAFLALVGLTAFVIWELRVENPAVNLRVLRNRGLAAGSLFAAVVGVGLYGGTFILPVFLQDLRHYTAQQSGMTLLPGAIATAIMMPFVGRLVSKFPPRVMVAVGALGFITSMYLMHTLTMDSSGQSIFWPLVLRGASMGFLFVPLSLATLAGLRGQDIASGTGLFNLFRQLGGSIGIALLSTFLGKRAQFHQQRLSERISLYNPLALQRIAGVQHALMAKGMAAAVAMKQSITILGGIIQGQAMILSFEDAFLFTGVIFIIALPLLLLFEKTTPVAAGKVAEVMAME